MYIEHETGEIESFEHSLPGSFDCWWYETIEEAEADGYRKFDFTYNPFAALPQWIGFHAVKEAAHEHQEYH